MCLRGQGSSLPDDVPGESQLVSWQGEEEREEGRGRGGEGRGTEREWGEPEERESGRKLLAPGTLVTESAPQAFLTISCN